MLKDNSPFKGMTMKQIASGHMVSNPNGLNQTVTATLSPVESRRNYAIQRNLSFKTFGPFVTPTRVALPNDTAKSQAARDVEQRRQTAMPWGNQRMHTPMDATRLNNVSQQSYIKQRRLVPDNTYGAFYAFMHALSAAFGTLQQGN